MSKPPDIRIRGIRQTIPSGYVLGRKGSADGPVQLLSLRDLGTQLAAGGVIPPVPFIFEYLGFFGEGPFTSQQQFQLPVAPRAVAFPSTQPTAQNKAWALNPPHADFSLVLTNNLPDYLTNGSAVICSVKFLAGQSTGTFTYTATPITVPVRGRPYLVMPVSVDALMGNLYLQFAGDPS